MASGTEGRRRRPLGVLVVLAVVVAGVTAARQRAFARSEAEFERLYGGR